MDTFALLEDKVRKAAALVRDLKQRNQSLERELPDLKKRNQRLEEELPELRSRVQDLQKALLAAEKVAPAPADDGLARKLSAASQQLASSEQEVKSLRQEREEVRLRIARLMEILDGLE
jgi:predicted  nucleic acid-binding Zn-ribbon protein